MITESVPIESLSQDPSNVREHGVRNVEAIKASLLRFGQQKPIVVDADGVVVAGNGTLGAAKLLGWTSLDVVRTELHGAEAVAFAIADNRSAELATWDNDELLLVLQQLDEPQLEAAGYNEDELAELLDTLNPPGEGDLDEGPEALVDKAEELNETWNVKRGDLWRIGEHRLLCGDATSEEDIATLKGGKVEGLVFSDPPFGVGYRDLKKKFSPIANDQSQTGIAALLSQTLETTSPIFLCCNWKSFSTFEQALSEKGKEIKACVVWDKGSGVQNLDKFYKQHEFIVYSGPFGGEKTVDGDVWFVPREVRKDHPTAKPVELCRRAIKHFPSSGFVYDPFIGSGTTMVASQHLGRKCYGMEIEPKYCAVVLDRMARMGLEPERDD